MTSIRTIDAHTAGEPLRLIVDGFPRVEGQDDARAARVGARATAITCARRSCSSPAGMRTCTARCSPSPSARIGRRRALHAQRGLQHDVRPRRDCGGDDRDRAWTDRAPAPRRDRARRACRAASTRARQFGVTATGTRVERVSFVNVPSFILRPAACSSRIAEGSRRRGFRRRVLRHRRQPRPPASRCGQNTSSS